MTGKTAHLHLAHAAVCSSMVAFCISAAQCRADQSGPEALAPRVQACASCHGSQGQGTRDDYFPRLAGKPSGYLFNQLVAFRDGRRKYPPMNYLLAYLPDEYLRKIADHFAAQRPPFPEADEPEVSADMLAHGEALAIRGDSARRIPACMACHGPSFTGMEPAIPGLLGLHATYISAQLGAWRYGTRSGIAPDCMQIVAGRLTETDVEAVAAWLASRPASGDHSPSPAGSRAMPLPCGSEPQGSPGAAP